MRLFGVSLLVSFGVFICFSICCKACLNALLMLCVLISLFGFLLLVKSRLSSVSFFSFSL